MNLDKVLEAMESTVQTLNGGLATYMSELSDSVYKGLTSNNEADTGRPVSDSVNNSNPLQACNLFIDKADIAKRLGVENENSVVITNVKQHSNGDGSIEISVAVDSSATQSNSDVQLSSLTSHGLFRHQRLIPQTATFTPEPNPFNVSININGELSEEDVNAMVQKAFEELKHRRTPVEPTPTVSEVLDELARNWKTLLPEGLEIIQNSPLTQSNMCDSCDSHCQKIEENFIGCEKNLLILLEEKHQEISNKRLILLDEFEKKNMSYMAKTGCYPSDFQRLYHQYTTALMSINETIKKLKGLDASHAYLKDNLEADFLFEGDK